MSSMHARAGNPVWRAAPTVLLRFRSLFAALAVGVFLVSVVASAYPMFLSASQNDLLGEAIDDGTVTPYGMGLAYRSTDVPIDAVGGRTPLWQRRAEAFAAAAARSPSLRPTEGHVFGEVVTVTGLDGAPPPTGVVDGRLFAGTGAIDHVEVRSGAEGDGLWLPDTVAEPLAVGPGDEVLLHSPAGEARVAVDGVYEGLYSQPRRGYWRLWNDDIYPCPEVDCVPPPQFIIAEPQQLLELSRTLGFDRANFAWQAPSRIEPALTLEEAVELAGFTRGFFERASAGGDLNPLLRCCGRWFTRHGTTEVTVTGNAELVVREVEQRIAALQGPMVVLLVAGVAIALGVVAAAGLFSTAARRVEIGVLTIRGWGPVALGVKASVEMMLPAAIGGLAGWFAAAALVAWVGPDAPPASSARATGAVAALAGTLAALAIVGVVSGLASVARHEQRHRATRALAAVPWELGFLALAWVFAGRLSEGGVLVVDGIERPQAEVYVLPLLVAMGVGIVCARLARLSLRWGTTVGGSGAGATWLAMRRLRSGAALTSVFVVAGVLTLSVSTTASSTVASLRATVEAKSKIFVGSDVQVWVTDNATPDPDYRYPVTRVTRMRDAGSLDDSEASYDLLVIEPDGFAAAAYWDDSFADESLSTLVARLTARPGPVPVIVANGAGAEPTSVTMGQEEVPVSVVGVATTFPGTSSDSRPLLVVGQTALDEALRGLPDPLATPRATTEIWVHGPPDTVLHSVDELGVLPQLVVTAEEVQDIPFIDAAVQTFLVLRVLGIAAAVLLIAVAVVYLRARQRGRVVATLLSDRMGMPRSTMRAASVVELGAMLAVSFVAGAVVGLVSSALVVPSIDPLPSIPPAPLIAVPASALLVTAAALAASAVVGGALADRGARARSTAEVMRVAE
jgi:putative ABC transport system permease protein